MRPALSRSVAVFRILALGYAAVLIAIDSDHYARPALGWTLLGVMAGWTVVAVIGYERLGSSPRLLLGVDIAIAVGMVLATLAVATTARIDAGAPTLPAAWAAAPVLMAAIVGGPWLGAIAGALVSAADIGERGAVTHHTFNGVVLLLLAGAVGGYVVRLTQRAEAVIEAAAAREAATDERDRLAREIHDSTLQVLALVARRGAEIGGGAAELASLAAEQEIALRQLMSSPRALDGSNRVDVVGLLGGLGSDRVTVSGPSEPVWVPADVAKAIGGAIGEALANVDRHVGRDARAWVLVEDEGTAVVVTVRDDGPGVSPERLAAAAAAGRLGVAQSIMGRVAKVGGTAAVTSAAGSGTEVEIRVPR